MSNDADEKTNKGFGWNLEIAKVISTGFSSVGLWRVQ